MRNQIAHIPMRGGADILYLDIKKSRPTVDLITCRERDGEKYFTTINLNVKQLRELTEELDKALRYINHPCISAKPGEIWKLELESGNIESAILTENGVWWFVNPIYANLKKQSSKIIGGEKLNLESGAI